jgi:hypothetical protein
MMLSPPAIAIVCGCDILEMAWDDLPEESFATAAQARMARSNRVDVTSTPKVVV